MLGQAPAAARHLHYGTIGQPKEGMGTLKSDLFFFCVNAEAVKLAARRFFLTRPPWLLRGERRSISTRHAGGCRAGLLPGRMGLLCVFTAVNRDVFRSHQWLRGQVSHYLFLLIVYSALMWWSSWSVGQEVEAKWHGGGTSCQRWNRTGTNAALLQLMTHAYVSNDYRISHSRGLPGEGTWRGS